MTNIVADVTIELPSVLSRGVGVPASITVEADSLEAALRSLVER